MKRIIAQWILFIPLFINAQNNGIQWTQDLTWPQVLAKAKKENKYIFLDLYATWCQPCHAMDKNVYPNEQVGQAINNKFISVKVQLNKTEYDNEWVKKWYFDAERIQKNYTITAFPTFLFFSPEGKPIHKDIGYKKSEEFVALVKDALIPQKQYYAILNNYQPGKLDTSELKGLANAFIYSGPELAGKLAAEYLNLIPKSEWGTHENLFFMLGFNKSPDMQKIALEYLMGVPESKFREEDNQKLILYFKSVYGVRDLVLDYLKRLDKMQLQADISLLSIFNKDTAAKKIADNYISSLEEKELYTQKNLQLINQFTTTTNEKGFLTFYHNEARIDKVMGVKNYAKGLVTYIIDTEEMQPYIKAADKEDNVPWKKIVKTIRKKYNKEYADRIILNAKTRLYKYYTTKYDTHWSEYIKYYIQKVEKYGTDTSGPQHQVIDAIFLNNFAFGVIFKHSNNKEEINTGIKWMEGVIRRNPKEANHVDTYANLLYKAGRREEAIQWQQKAIQTAIEQKQDFLLSTLKDNLAKMEKGEPTWIVKRDN